MELFEALAVTAQGGDPGRAQLHPRPHVRVAGRGGAGGGPHQAAPAPRARRPAGHPPPLRPARAARDEQPRPGAALEDDLSPRPHVLCCVQVLGRPGEETSQCVAEARQLSALLGPCFEDVCEQKLQQIQQECLQLAASRGK